MKIKLSYIALMASLGLFFTACQKEDYIIGGDMHDPHVNMTTYDYLKSKPLFDTLVLLIDKAGIKNEINASNTTFLAPTDYSIAKLLKKRTEDLQNQMNDENIKYTINDFPVNELRDSLRANLFKATIKREGLSSDPKVFKNEVGEDFSFRLTQGSSGFSTAPQFLYVAKVKNGLDPMPLPELYPTEDIEKYEVVQTSGILTTNGVLHVMNNIRSLNW